nr:hypothetical protein CFP56_24368 [Quercus suber]
MFAGRAAWHFQSTDDSCRQRDRIEMRDDFPFQSYVSGLFSYKRVVTTTSVWETLVGRLLQLHSITHARFQASAAVAVDADLVSRWRFSPQLSFVGPAPLTDVTRSALPLATIDDNTVHGDELQLDV